MADAADNVLPGISADRARSEAAPQLLDLPAPAWLLLIEALQPTDVDDHLESLMLPQLARGFYACPELAWALARAIGFTLNMVACGLRDEALFLRALDTLSMSNLVFRWACLPGLVKSLPESCSSRAVAVRLWRLQASASRPQLECWRENQSVVLDVVTWPSQALYHMDERANLNVMRLFPRFRLDPEVVLANLNVMRMFPRFRLDPEVVLAAVRSGQMSLLAVPEPLRDHREILKAALSLDATMVCYVPEYLRRDASFVEEVLASNCDLLMTMGAWLNVEQAMLAVRTFPLDGLADLPETMVRSNPEIWRTALRLDARAISYCPSDMLTHGDVLAAVRRIPSVLLNLPWRNDRGLLMEALQLDGTLFGRLGNEVRFDADLAMAAVKQNGAALEFVPREILDAELVGAALRQNGLALAWARLEDRQSPRLVEIAAAQNPEARFFSRLLSC